MSTWSSTNVIWNSPKQFIFCCLPKKCLINKRNCQLTLLCSTLLCIQGDSCGLCLSVLPMGSVSLQRVCLWQWSTQQASRSFSSMHLKCFMSAAFICIVKPHSNVFESVCRLSDKISVTEYLLHCTSMVSVSFCAIVVYPAHCFVWTQSFCKA